MLYKDVRDFRVYIVNSSDETLNMMYKDVSDFRDYIDYDLR